MFGSLLGKLKGAKKDLSRFNNQNFVDASMAAAALVAMADGNLDESEEDQVVNAINTGEQFKSFDTTVLVTEFGKNIEALRTGGRLGKRTVGGKLNGVIGQTEACEAVALIAIDIAESEGGIGSEEQQVLDIIGQKLEVDMNALMNDF